MQLMQGKHPINLVREKTKETQVAKEEELVNESPDIPKQEKTIF